eukprot:UN10820
MGETEEQVFAPPAQADADNGSSHAYMNNTGLGSNGPNVDGDDKAAIELAPYNPYGNNTTGPIVDNNNAQNV